jgi:hypothetical protein
MRGPNILPGLLGCNPLAERLIQPFYGVAAYVLKEVGVAVASTARTSETSENTSSTHLDE